MKRRYPGQDISALGLNMDLLFEALTYCSPLINPRVGEAEPPEPHRRAGMLAFANGTDWNPGSGGAGFYWYDGAAWQKL